MPFPIFSSFFAFLVWDPSRFFFVIPGIEHPITWYGVIFAFAFFFDYLLGRWLLKNDFLKRKFSYTRAKKESARILDALSTYCLIGTIVGARLGDVLFYGLPEYEGRFFAIFKIWEGGLSSHGAALGILLALFIFYLSQRKKEVPLSFLFLLDFIVILAPFAGGCIRIGNFINQEILGIPTSLPWGVIFLHPLAPVEPVPLHPVQLYESFFYFGTFLLLVGLWKRKCNLGEGLLAGLFFLLVFGFRFFIEYLKLPQSEWINESFLNVGQWLSIPSIGKRF